MKTLAATLVLLAVALSGCATLGHGTVVKSWSGTATWPAATFAPLHYSAECVLGLEVNGAAQLGAAGMVGGRFVGPIYLDANVCAGDGSTRAVLAHEVANATVCGADDACAAELGAAWVDAGVTLPDLGWPDPPLTP